MKSFFNRARKIYQSKEGPIELPIFYYDLSSVILAYLVDAVAAENLLKGSGLRPALYGRNKAMVMLAFFEYRESSIGPYNEVALATMACPEKGKRPVLPLTDFLRKGRNWRTAAYIHNLPVSTEIANAGGREIWSLPKFVAPISFELKKSGFRGAVTDAASKQEILRVEGRSGALGIKNLFHAIDMVFYSIHEGRILKTVVETQGRSFYSLGGDFRIALADSGHEMTENARALGLDRRKPAFTIISERLKSILPEGTFIE